MNENTARVRKAEAMRKPDALAPSAPVVSIGDARRRRAEALLKAEDVPDQMAESRAWNDRPRRAS